MACSENLVVLVPSQCGPEWCCRQWPAGKAERGHLGLSCGSKVWPFQEWLYPGSCSGLHPSPHCSCSGSDWSEGHQRILRTGAILCRDKIKRVPVLACLGEVAYKYTFFYSEYLTTLNNLYDSHLL